jgi:hypothetical protein
MKTTKKVSVSIPLDLVDWINEQRRGDLSSFSTKIVNAILIMKNQGR